jgi:hypothetical protein
MPWTTKLSLGGGGGGGGGEYESVGEAQEQTFFVLHIHSKKLFKKMVDFSQKSSFHYAFSSQISKNYFLVP